MEADTLQSEGANNESVSTEASIFRRRKVVSCAKETLENGTYSNYLNRILRGFDFLMK